MKKLFVQSGASILELLVAMGIFTVGVVTVLVLTYDAGSHSRSTVERTKATFLAMEGIEAVRTIRDNDFEDLINGTYGLALSDNWTLNGSSDIQDNYTRTITIADGTTGFEKKVTSRVVWQVTPTRSEDVEFTEYLSNWNHPPLTEIDCFNVDLSTASIEQGSVHKIVRYIWISNPSCGYDINLDKIVLTWNSPGNNIFKVRIDSNFLWQGNAVSGTTLDLSPNETLMSGAPAIEIDQLRWFQSILGTDIGVKFIMSDGSNEQFTIPAFTD